MGQQWNSNYNDEHVTTKFNGSLMALERMNKLLEECNFYSTVCSDVTMENSKYLIMWLGVLRCFEKEINSKMSKEEVLKIQKLFKKSNVIHKVTTYVATPMGKMLGFNPSAFDYCRRLFNYTETSLRRIADNKGLLLINEDEEGM